MGLRCHTPSAGLKVLSDGQLAVVRYSSKTLRHKDINQIPQHI
jgi:hypothetical protein